MPPRKQPTNGRNRRMWHVKKLDTQTREVVRDMLQLLVDKGGPQGNGLYYNFEYNKEAVDAFTSYIEAHDVLNNAIRPGIVRYRKNSIILRPESDVQIAQRILNTYSKWVELGADRLAYHGNLFLHDYHYRPPNRNSPPNRNIASNVNLPNQIQNANKITVQIGLSTPKGRAALRSAPYVNMRPVDNNRTHWNLEVRIATDRAGFVGFPYKNESVHLTFPLWDDSWLRAQLQGSKTKPAFDINSIRSTRNIPRYGIVQQRCLLRLWKEFIYGLLESNIHTLLH